MKCFVVGSGRGDIVLLLYCSLSKPAPVHILPEGDPSPGVSYFTETVSITTPYNGAPLT